RRHGRSPDSRRDRPSLVESPRRKDARLRARRPHGHVVGGRLAARTEPAFFGHGPPHFSACRGTRIRERWQGHGGSRPVRTFPLRPHFCHAQPPRHAARPFHVPPWRLHGRGGSRL